jgi:hypothetical protein
VNSVLTDNDGRLGLLIELMVARERADVENAMQLSLRRK